MEGSEGLLSILRQLFRDSNTQVNLCFDLDLPRFYFNKHKVSDVSLPISDLGAAHEALEKTMRREKHAATDRHAHSSGKRREHLDQCHMLLCDYLEFLERQQSNWNTWQ